ncbi:response regulator transcription factor [Anaerocolumna sp. AGMB13025]|uniref:response regulator transcription factor n=1 Tax=Anaerocolumna sp. AGMB13025 TaxID=3039116 RepID=UPI00241C9892|nr:response regulator transcription factor [Anaerocolumna sp. AGMB13025]WFR58506.1 response regulator transcription factor [Anaerocolumna sp. AGMB13025]
MNYSILIVEDDNDICKMLEEALIQPDYTIYTAMDGKEALEMFRKHNDLCLILLDLMLPELDGLSVLKKIRETSTVPILILSAKSGEYEKVLGLEFGADDYITKPFSVMELQARVKAFIRRTTQYQKEPEAQSGEKITVGEIEMELDNFIVKKNREIINLTAKEFNLLKLFITHPGKVYTKVQLYKEIWDDNFLNDENVVNVQIRRLREKIETNPSEPEYIKTIWGIGYKLGEFPC